MHFYGISPWSKNDENTSALFTKKSFKIEPISMLFLSALEPPLHLGLCDVACALSYLLIQNVSTRWLHLGHFQGPREPPKYPVPVSFDQKFDVAVLVVPPGLYAPFLIFRYCFHALRLQTHSGFGRYALSRPHCKHVSSFANIRKIQIISMEKLMGTMHFDSSVQLRFTTRYVYQVVPEAAVRGVRDAFPCCLFQRLCTTNKASRLCHQCFHHLSGCFSECDTEVAFSVMGLLNSRCDTCRH